MTGPRISFYSLPEDTRGDRFQLACRLVERIYSTGLRTYILVAAEYEARHLDRLLWTFRDQSFLPHGLTGEADVEATPILIGWDPEPCEACPVLVNLTSQTPAGLDRIERLCEVIDHDPQIRSAGRIRYRHYRHHGIVPEHHVLRP